MGRMGRGYNNVAPGGQSVSILGSATMKLNNQIGRSNTVATPLSSVFGGRTVPFTY